MKTILCTLIVTLFINYSSTEVLACSDFEKIFGVMHSYGAAYFTGKIGEKLQLLTEKEQNEEPGWDSWFIVSDFRVKSIEMLSLLSANACMEYRAIADCSSGDDNFDMINESFSVCGELMKINGLWN